MNERIRQLAEQAGFENGHQDRYGNSLSQELAKFADMIVRECAEMVRIQNEQFMENESHYGVVSTDILKHFGVEE